MSGHSFVFWMLLLAFFAAVSQAMVRHIDEPRCIQCGGKGQHKDDCPWRDDDRSNA